MPLSELEEKVKQKQTGKERLETEIEEFLSEAEGRRFLSEAEGRGRV
jgi:hypothetical protein